MNVSVNQACHLLHSFYMYFLFQLGTGNSNNTSSNLPYISCIIGGSALILGLVIILTVVSVVLVIVLKYKNNFISEEIFLFKLLQ